MPALPSKEHPIFLRQLLSPCVISVYPVAPPSLQLRVTSQEYHAAGVFYLLLPVQRCLAVVKTSKQAHVHRQHSTSRCHPRSHDRCELWDLIAGAGGVVGGRQSESAMRHWASKVQTVDSSCGDVDGGRHVGGGKAAYLCEERTQKLLRQ